MYCKSTSNTCTSGIPSYESTFESTRRATRTICIRILFRIYFRKYMYVYVYSKCTVIVTFDGTFVLSYLQGTTRKYFRKYSILSVRRYLRTKGYIATYSTYGNTEIDEKNTIQRFFWFDPAILAFPVKMPIHYSTALVLRPRTPWVQTSVV